ncbi:MAG TPA: ABC transporter permease [Candidatus Binataceae bacterium]|nr:ABC transporter permease [Candidatus Binataceae bacterium]
MPTAAENPFYRLLYQVGSIGSLTLECIRDVFRRPFEFRLLMEQLDDIGWGSLNVINLTAIFSGMVLALQMGEFLGRFGAKIYVSRIMGISMLREMGPVLTALMIGARVGAGITAEIGTMAVTEQIDALRALAVSPIKRLVVPRLIATIVMLPMLTIVADVVGLVGGLMISVVELGLSAEFFYTSLLRALTVKDVVGGLAKAAVFGYLIAIIACAKGLGTRGGADGVGQATTSTVVAASISVLVADFFVTKLLLSV